MRWYNEKNFGISFIIPSVYAYDFENPDNSSKVNEDITEINDLIEMYKEFVGEDDFAESDVDYEVANVDAYWWPIGSKETTKVDDKLFATGDPVETYNSSPFGPRGNEIHTGQDIADPNGIDGEINIIAAKSGVVIKPTDKNRLDCKQYDCNIGYGNYVVIQHSDGNYTYYGHLHENSITVKAGDTVDQGQVIGKMGNSGNSTGPHLHFEVRIGEDTPSAAVNPLDYVDKDNPRPKGGLSGDAVDMAREVITHYEGIACPEKADENNYMACYADYDGVTTIGAGVVVEYNRDYFKKYGYDNVSDGTMVPKDIVDKIKNEIIEKEHGNAVKECLSKAGIDDLKDYQVAALISRSYNQGPATVCSNDVNFIDAYKKYKGQYSLDDMHSTKGSLWTESMNNYIRAKGVVYEGLQRRRAGEYVWFVTGEINYYCDNACFNASDFVW